MKGRGGGLRKKGDNGVFYASRSGGTLKQRKERERGDGCWIEQLMEEGGGYPD